MKRSPMPFLTLISLMIVAVHPASVFAEAETIDLKSLAQNARPAVMLLVVSDASGKEIAKGTGFLVSGDGKLITNHHVIENAASVVAKADNGGLFHLKGVLADDPKNDLVLLKLEGKDLPFISLGNSDKIEVGTRIAVIGSPLGLEGTLSEGIVSAERDLEGEFKMLQITAAISPGSSGSPVLNAKGEVVGVARALLQEGQALNFAVPVSYVRALTANSQKTFSVRSFNTTVVSDADKIFTDPDWSATFLARDAQDYVELLKHAQALVRRFPESPHAYAVLGEAFERLNFLTEAVTACKEAIKLKPDHAMAWVDLAQAYGDAGRVDEAIIAWKQVLKIEPDYEWAWSLLGNQYNQVGQTDEAITAYRRAITLKPDDSEVWGNLGVAHSNAGRKSDAIAAFRQAIKLDPNDAIAWYNLGGTYSELGRTENAIASLREAVKIKPDYATAWHNLGVVYQQAGKAEDAAAAFQRARELNPSLFK
jgi:tetratricopeptide (TPR) repeat protein